MGRGPRTEVAHVVPRSSIPWDATVEVVRCRSHIRDSVLHMLKHRLWLAMAFLALAVACRGETPRGAEEYEIALLWEFAAGDYVRGGIAAGDSLVFFGSDDNAMHAVDAETGSALWSYETADNVTSRPAIEDGIICFGSWDGHVRALRLSDGGLVWEHETRGWVSAPIVAADGIALVGSEDHTLYALSLADGSLVWSARTSGAIVAAARQRANAAETRRRR